MSKSSNIITPTIYKKILFFVGNVFIKKSKNAAVQHTNATIQCDCIAILLFSVDVIFRGRRLLDTRSVASLQSFELRSITFVVIEVSKKQRILNTNLLADLTKLRFSPLGIYIYLHYTGCK